MKPNVIITFMGILYSMILREILVKAIDDPTTEWDDLVLSICDRVFGYDLGSGAEYIPKTKPE